MFFKNLMENKKYQVDLHKKETFKKKRKAIIVPHTVSCAFGMLFMFVLIMSLMIVKVSSTATFQNQTSATIRLRNIRNYKNSTIIANATTTTTIIEKVETTTGTTTTTLSSTRRRKSSKIRSSVTNRTLATAPKSAQKSTQSKRTNWKPRKNQDEKKMRADAQQQTRERLQMHQLQQQRRQQRQHQQQHIYQEQQFENEYHEGQQKQMKQLKRQQHRQQNELRSHANVLGEKAFLVEHAAADDNDEDKSEIYDEQQPIYGTWHTKGKRQQAPLVSQRFLANQNATSLENASSSSISAGGLPPAPTPTTLAASNGLNADGEDVNDQNYQKYHVYERLPRRRSSTMTPIRNELSDQIPRPPKLTSRRPSLNVRRQYLESPVPINSSSSSYSIDNEPKPKPFQFPFEGPMPEEFKKIEPERNEVNNIQEILQQLQISSTPTRATQFFMMPTGLHIAGSYKNFKASGIANFFRNKRNKKPVQLTFPLPMPMSLPMPYYGAYQPQAPPQPIYGSMQQQQHQRQKQIQKQQQQFILLQQQQQQQQPYQRIAMDQFYPFKPRSPNEINLLAMQQQLNANLTKNKKKKNMKIQQQQKQQQQQLFGLNTGLYGYSNNSLYMQQTNQRPEHYLPHYPQQWLAYNATQKPKLKRIPFKLNLDIYPMLPPTKEHIPIPLRSSAALTNPYAEYSTFRYPYGPPNIIYPYMQTQYKEQPALYNNAIRYRTTLPPHLQPHTAPPPPPPPPTPPSPAAAQSPQSNNMQMTFPDQIPKYSQQYAQQHQHQQQQEQQQPQQYQYQRSPMNPQHNSFVPIDCIDSAEGDNANDDSTFNPSANQIMVHLNVYPKPKPKPSSPTPLPSTNPFYNFHNRNTLAESAELPNSRSRQIPNDNGTQQQQQQKAQNHDAQIQQRIARSDSNNPLLVDFEHPIVAADIADMPHPTTFINNKLDTSPYYDHIETRSNFPLDSEANLEQMAREAKAASLFRFPVEDLIQFHVDDAL